MSIEFPPPIDCIKYGSRFIKRIYQCIRAARTIGKCVSFLGRYAESGEWVEFVIVGSRWIKSEEACWKVIFDLWNDEVKVYVAEIQEYQGDSCNLKYLSEPICDNLIEIQKDMTDDLKLGTTAIGDKNWTDLGDIIRSLVNNLDKFPPEMGLSEKELAIFRKLLEYDG